MTDVLVLRPQPGGDATVRRAAALGLEAIAAPLFEVRSLPWSPPDPAKFDAIIMTSANAGRLAGKGLTHYRDLPVFAVGEATAAKAREAGFDDVIAGQGDAAAILNLAISHGKSRLLHLAGREHMDLRHPCASIDCRIVYGSEAVPVLPPVARDALEAGAIALLHSVRAARHFAGLIDAETIRRGDVATIGLSKAVRAAAGEGWALSLAAPSPNDEALLAIAARLCDQSAHGDRARSGKDRA